MNKNQFISLSGNLNRKMYLAKSQHNLITYPQHVYFKLKKESAKVELYQKYHLSVIKKSIAKPLLPAKLNIFTSSIPEKKIILKCVLSIGYRCYSAEFLKNYNLRKFSGPFDYMCIDMETCFKAIHNNYYDFLNDIIVMYRNEKSVKLMYQKKTREIKKNIVELLENDIRYMADNYNNSGLLINQNYIDDNTLSGNLYDWNSICLFLHHAIQSEDIYKQLKMRCDRSQRLMQKYGETTCLFFISKIVNCSNITDYMNDIIRMKQKYNIVSFLTMILCCDNLEDTHFYNESNKCLFIVKKVEDYETQYSRYRTDNNYSYDKEYNLISQYFDFQLLEKNDV
jgi:hypothetical protein